MNKSKIGLPSKPKENRRNEWVQTDKSAHEAWARLILKHKNAAAFMHLLVSRMDRNTNAVVASHSVLAKMLECSARSIRNYISVLERDRWIQVVSLGKGSTNAYVVNSMVAWSQSRDNLKYSQFTAQVIAEAADQQGVALEGDGDLRKIPVLFAGDEQQLPSGESDTPPTQMLIHGAEPELPSIKKLGES